MSGKNLTSKNSKNETLLYMVKIENPETPENDRKLSKSIKHPVLTVYRY